MIAMAERRCRHEFTSHMVCFILYCVVCYLLALFKFVFALFARSKLAEGEEYRDACDDSVSALWRLRRARALVSE